jgi:hypothetical protein
MKLPKRLKGRMWRLRPGELGAVWFEENGDLRIRITASKHGRGFMETIARPTARLLAARIMDALNEFRPGA